MTQVMAEWQRGFELDYLRRFTELLNRHDEGYAYGRFALTSERTVAEYLERGELLADDSQQPSALILARPQRAAGWIADFTGAGRAQVQSGDIRVRKVAGDPGWIGDQISELAADGERVWIETWAEHPQDRALLADLGAIYALTKIRASSEIITVSLLDGRGGMLSPIEPLPDFERPGLCQIPGGYPIEPLNAALAELELGFADHYSVYGKGRSWGAISLRGYGPPGEPADPDFIIKPGDMSKKWKAENPEKLGWQPAWSDLGLALAPELEAFLPDAGLDRVRLMRLTPGGGEIERHADIVDREAGMRDGMVARLHFPLVTNPDVIFNSWSLEGEPLSAHMVAGSSWYLDIRKPHTVLNGGSEDRIHLVVDALSDERLRELIMAGA